MNTHINETIFRCISATCVVVKHLNRSIGFSLVRCVCLLGWGLNRLYLIKSFKRERLFERFAVSSGWKIFILFVFFELKAMNFNLWKITRIHLYLITGQWIKIGVLRAQTRASLPCALVLEKGWSRAKQKAHWWNTQFRCLSKYIHTHIQMYVYNCKWRQFIVQIKNNLGKFYKI